jgi:adenylate cyclase
MISINVYRYINEEKEKMESLRQRDFIRNTFGRYMSDEVVEELLGSPEGLSMNGENCEVTFLVSDLRGFTALSEKLIPNEVIEILNRYFEHMVEVIARYRGTVSEFMGDGILAFFGAPLNADDDPERAVACAIEMQNTLVAVNAKQRKLNLPELAMGIGINTGKVVVGNIGSERRAKYGVVGMPINVAFRIESFTIGGQILISANTHKKVSSLVRIRGTKEVMFKGIEKPMCLYNVNGINGLYKVSLLETKMKPLTELDSPFPIDCFIMEGKTVSDAGITGQITHIGESIAEVFLTHKVEAHTNLRIVHSEQGGPRFSALYAKVLPKEEHSAKLSDESVLIKFSTMPNDIKKFFAKACQE